MATYDEVERHPWEETWQACFQHDVLYLLGRTMHTLLLERKKAALLVQGGKHVGWFAFEAASGREYTCKREQRKWFAYSRVLHV